MHRGRMEKLAHTLETVDEINGMKFDMSVVFMYGDYRVDPIVSSIRCGSVGCIAGWACALFGEPNSAMLGCTARHLLGLSEDQARELFFPSNYRLFPDMDNPYEATAKQAAVAVRRLMAEEFDNQESD